MINLPLHFNLQEQRVLLVGGGEIARRKAALLRRAGAHLRIVAPRVDDALRMELCDACEVLMTTYDPSHIDGVMLVVAATNDSEVNARVSRDAQARYLPVNVVDQPALSTVVFPAIIDRSPIVVSIGSGGASPSLVTRIRGQVESLLGEGTSRLAAFLGERRPWLKQQWPDVDTRRRVVENFLDSPGRTLAEQGDVSAADYFVPAEVVGEVYLVGAGPGDPDLLTLRALQAMQRADVILYDNLVSSAVLDRCRRDANFEFVGKRSGYLSTSQESIIELMLRLVSEGQRVVRLKGGDPFVFGRGGEEIAPLIERGIPFQVIPGVTAANGCAAYAGIPLTHRDHAQSVRFVTGHPVNGDVVLPWNEYVTPGQTLVFYMGLGGIGAISRHLITHGMDPLMPVAVIAKGTTPDQRIALSTLERIPGLIGRLQLESPTLIIIGQVVSTAPGWRDAEARDAAAD